uniref:Uncharacterized protein n=1 Tax=Anguilla anguilla TaxID=7936 RepID=A0A0E9UUH0_ANGAN
MYKAKKGKDLPKFIQFYSSLLHLLVSYTL